MEKPDHAPTEAPALRSLRIAALAGLSIIVALLIVPAVALFSPTLREAIVSIFNYGYPYRGLKDSSQLTVAAVIFLPILVVAAGIFLAAWLLRLHSWRRIAIGYVAVAAVLAYMAYDDPAVRRPLALDEFSPAFPGAEESFRVLMRYGMQQPLGRDFREPKFNDPYPDWGNREPGPWRQTITSHRAEIEAHWLGLAPERAWWAELNGFDRIGDLTPAKVDAELLSFRVLRAMSQHGLAIASLQAVDGRGDEAVATLLPILQVGRKLQPSARILVRAMMGVVMERISLQAASFILETTPVSAAARARLALALAAGPGDAKAGARRLMTIQYAFSTARLEGEAHGRFMNPFGDGEKHAWLRLALNMVNPFIYNRRATINLAGDLSADLQDIAGSRQVEKLGPRMERFAKEDARPRFKNLLGMLFLEETNPAYSKVAENYWRAEDERAALLARVAVQ
jgi:hypothetical protein